MEMAVYMLPTTKKALKFSTRLLQRVQCLRWQAMQFWDHPLTGLALTQPLKISTAFQLLLMETSLSWMVL
jgi:hypothetical protein